MDVADELDEYARQNDLGIILWAVIGGFGCHSHGSTCYPLLPWAEDRRSLDYTCNHGFGTAKIHSFTSWTTTHVIFVVEYDGSTQYYNIPRNPISHTPAMPGGRR